MMSAEISSVDLQELRAKDIAEKLMVVWDRRAGEFRRFGGVVERRFISVCPACMRLAATIVCARDWSQLPEEISVAGGISIRMTLARLMARTHDAGDGFECNGEGLL